MTSDSESDWSDIEEVLDGGKHPDNILCLFCESSLSAIEDCFIHIKEIHQVDIKSTISVLHLDFYGYVKFVNFIRRKQLQPTDVRRLSKDSFISDEFLQPTREGDMMLQFDVDSFIEDVKTNNKTANGIDIETKLSVAEERAKLAEEFLERTLDDLNNCRTELKSLLLGESTKCSDNSSNNAEENVGYFSSYAHYGIHEEMLKDTTRTEAYRNFILNNLNVFKGCSVLDVGCGSAILSMFAAKAGAAKIIGVDNSEVAYQAMDIVKENGLENTISIIKGRAEDLCFPEKVDVIVSEWMGYFLLFESMLDTVIYCRDNFLANGGRIYPDKCNIKLAAIADQDLYASKVNYWDSVYGFKMSAMKSHVLEEPLIDIVDNKHFISKPVKVKEFDLMSISVSDLDFEESFKLNVTRNGVCSSIVGYFDILFGEEQEEIANPVTFSTSPDCTPTHWKQTIFLLKEPISCKVGDTLNGRIFCRKNKKDKRALDIALIFYDDKNNVKLRQHYVIS